MSTPAPPPGPRSPGLAQTASYWLSPQLTLRRWQRRFGDVVSATVYPMGRSVFLYDAEHIKELVRAGQDWFRAGAANSTLGGGAQSNSSVLVTDGEPHANARALLTPSMHGRAVRRQLDDIDEITAGVVAGWPVGRPFALYPSCRTIALDAILRVVMGFDDGDLDDVREAMILLGSTESMFEVIVSSPLLTRVLPRLRARRRRYNEAHQLLREQIDRHRRDPGLGDRTDALALLLTARTQDGEPLSDRDVEDQLLTLIVAGYETTAAGLAWTFERLSRHPEVLARARRAADDGDDDYLDALVKEVLRIRTVVPDLGRMAMADTELAGYRIARGSIVVPCVDLVHIDPALFDDPMTFRPERFLDDRGAAASWMPFGGGVRRCLGATFALLEMRTAISRILREVDIDTTTRRSERSVRAFVTVEPSRGAVVTVRPRVRAAAEAG